MSDVTDVCARAATLRQRYDEAITGQQVTSLKYGERSITRAPLSGAALDALRSHMEAAEAECARLKGVRIKRRRYAGAGRF